MYLYIHLIMTPEKSWCSNNLCTDWLVIVSFSFAFLPNTSCWMITIRFHIQYITIVINWNSIRSTYSKHENITIHPHVLYNLFYKNSYILSKQRYAFLSTQCIATSNIHVTFLIGCFITLTSYSKKLKALCKEAHTF